MSLQQLPAVEQTHQDEWQASCIPQAIIDRNFQTITDPRAVDELLNRNTDKDKRWKHSEALTPGWVVTGVDLEVVRRLLDDVRGRPGVRCGVLEGDDVRHVGRQTQDDLAGDLPPGAHRDVVEQRGQVGAREGDRLLEGLGLFAQHEGLELPSSVGRKPPSA